MHVSPRRRLAPLSAVLFLVLSVPACGGAVTGPEAGPDDPDPAPGASVVPVETGEVVVLAVGEVASFQDAGVEATFVRLVSDSRCPTGLTCVWEGDAEVELDVAVRGGGSTDVRLHTTLEPRTAPAGAYRLELVDVRPHPTADPLADPPRPTVAVRLVPAR